VNPSEIFGPAPARESHVTVRDRWAECLNLADGDPRKPAEFFHRQLNEELNVLENAARNLVEFPDADWEIRMWLARQCADEARHTVIYQRLLERRGGRFGDYPVLNFQFKLLGRINTLIGRLAVENRTFEADGLDAAVFGASDAREAGDQELADVYDMQVADERMHVRFANEWIKAAIKKEPRLVLEVARALTLGSRAFSWVFADGGSDVTKYPVAEQERLQAGFDPEEVRVAADMSRSRREDVQRRRSS
jgi:uncharacterized ferritin-like protein (DUF455 family)